MKKKNPCQVDIPQNLISEVDRVVLETGLYSDKAEFVLDAVRRLILDSNKDEMDWISSGKTSKPREDEVQSRGKGFSNIMYQPGKSRPIQDNKR